MIRRRDELPSDHRGIPRRSPDPYRDCMEALRRLRQELRRHPQLEDVVLAAAFALLTIVTTLSLVRPFSPNAPSDAVIVGWALLYNAPLAFRRRWPLVVLVVMTVEFLTYWGVGQDNEIGSWIGLGAGVYAAAAYGARPKARWVFGGCLALVAGSILLQSDDQEVTGLAGLIGVILFASMPFALGWPLGSMMRELRHTRAVLEHRNAELAAEREASAQRAVLEERVRIARELHDVVAHHVSVMAVQAAAARRLFRSRPDDAVEAIAAVEEAGRDAIVDLHQLVGVLRDEEPRELAPQPRMDQLPRLLAGVEQAGLPVHLVVEGERRALPAGVELSAYRIVQEALTNTIKHAGATRADVHVRYAGGGIELDVTDDGHAKAAVAGDRINGGKGLLGMRERASVHGGTLVAGPLPTGGFRVHAVLRGAAP
jgi:signal transduction histidine kinase